MHRIGLSLTQSSCLKQHTVFTFGVSTLTPPIQGSFQSSSNLNYIFFFKTIPKITTQKFRLGKKCYVSTRQPFQSTSKFKSHYFKSCRFSTCKHLKTVRTGAEPCTEDTNYKITADYSGGTPKKGDLPLTSFQSSSAPQLFISTVCQHFYTDTLKNRSVFCDKTAIN